MNIGRASDGGDDSSINPTPLIDVVFQLLIFFMITMTFSSHNEYLLPVDLAEAAAGEPDDDNEFDGMTITAGTPSRPAWCATPWAKFPADAATTPAVPVGRVSSRFNAPRSL